jgi:hypothetical protein
LPIGLPDDRPTLKIEMMKITQQTKMGSLLTAELGCPEAFRQALAVK